MAEQLNPASGENVTAKHNIGNRKKMMQDALAENFALDGKITAALEKHVKPYRDAKRDIKAKLREDLNITPAVFNARYAAYRLEGRAIAADDEATLDTLRELFEHSPVGTQMDMMDGLGGAKGNGEDKAPKANAKRPARKKAAKTAVSRGVKA